LFIELFKRSRFRVLIEDGFFDVFLFLLVPVIQLNTVVLVRLRHDVSNL